MLRLLLDEHLAHAVANQLRSHRPNLEVHGLSHWREGVYLGASDELLLEAAAVDRLTLVTYDVHTIPALLHQWAEAGRSHAGVVLISRRQFPLGEIGGVIRSLVRLSDNEGSSVWTDRVAFLQP